MTIRWSPEAPRERAAFLALALTPGIGHRRIGLLQEPFDSPLGAVSAPFAFLRAIAGVSDAAATAIAGADVEAALRVVRDTEAMGAHVLLLPDADYPAILRDIPDPPLALFVLGDPALLARAAVAIVGSRNLSPYGVEACRIVADAAVQGGAAVVSGMARGVDAEAHEATLAAGGLTIGVLGNGLGVVYPSANRYLYDAVAANGVLVSEFPPGDRPRVYTFPRRNRIVSGLARVTVVVEAAQASGALITAGAALEQGREVMAVPGPITSPTSVGTNALIRDGATPFLVPDDLWRLLPGAPAAPREPRPEVRRPAPRPDGTPLPPLPPGLAPLERRAAELLATELGADELAERLGLAASDMLALVTALELRGLVEPLAGQRFRRRLA